MAERSAWQERHQAEQDKYTDGGDERVQQAAQLVRGETFFLL